MADFVWLRDGLVKEFPISYVPPLLFAENKPNDLDYIETQKRFFQVDNILSIDFHSECNF